MQDGVEVIMQPIKEEVLEITHRCVAESEQEQIAFCRGSGWFGRLGVRGFNDVVRTIFAKDHPTQSEKGGKSSSDDKSDRPIKAINERAENRVHQGVGHNRRAGYQPVRPGLLLWRKPVAG